MIRRSFYHGHRGESSSERLFSLSYFLLYMGLLSSATRCAPHPSPLVTSMHNTTAAVSQLCISAVACTPCAKPVRAPRPQSIFMVVACWFNTPPALYHAHQPRQQDIIYIYPDIRSRICHGHACGCCERPRSLEGRPRDIPGSSLGRTYKLRRKSVLNPSKCDEISGSNIS